MMRRNRIGVVGIGALAAAGWLVWQLGGCATDQGAGSGGAKVADAAAAGTGKEALLSGTRQFVLAGKRSGEGYFSAGGKYMVFQSERREDNPFYQIYLLELASGRTRLISPGFGKTTCAWVHPSEKRALFASTHEDPKSEQLQKEELAFRASGQSRRYSWDYDEHFEIYETDLEAGGFKNLTKARGYDAEGSYSPDGQWIAFSSNRHAYDRELSAADAARLKVDQQHFLEIYIMRADGSQVKRLTNEPGYDGGPFFSPDGRRICWRRFNEKGTMAEVWTMNIDGSDAKQITKLGAMSWAPFYHPSGKYMIFTTNKHGFDNFELYLVDTEGLREPVRVTETEGFDGLAAFTHDGKRLAWAAKRAMEGTQTQIYIADWDHAGAMKKLGL